MSKGQPYLPRSETDEQLIVEEMMSDQHLEHWEECNIFVKRCVYAKAKNIPNNLLDDMVQEIMYKIAKYLPHFRFQCILKTWVNQIIEHHIIDEYRKLRNEEPHLFHETDSDNQELNESEVVSAEDAFETNEKMRIGIEALLEYATSTSNSIRNRHIIRMVLFEGKTYEEVATSVGCNPPVVGHVVREAQRHAREKMSD